MRRIDFLIFGMSLGLFSAVASAQPEQEDVRSVCTRQATDAGLTNQADILEYVSECVSLLSQNTEPAQDVEASGQSNPPRQQ